MPVQVLSDSEFHQTFSPHMKQTAELLIGGSLLDEYLSELEAAAPDLLDWQAAEIELSYVGQDGHFQHLLFPEGRKNIYLVVVADIEKKLVIGHHLLDLNEKYGIPTPPKSKRL